MLGSVFIELFLTKLYVLSGTRLPDLMLSNTHSGLTTCTCVLDLALSSLWVLEPLRHWDDNICVAPEAVILTQD